MRSNKDYRLEWNLTTKTRYLCKGMGPLLRLRCYALVSAVGVTV
jgi:hypothetical protein